MKKAFTLIELLAVIIVLAVIALIATPKILDVVKSSKYSAAKDSVYGVLHSANYYYAEEYMKNNGSFSEYECSFINGLGCDNLQISGDKPTKGNLIINKAGIINGKLEFSDYVFYICNNKVLTEETSECSFIEYEKIYAINESGFITGFKTQEVATILEYIIPVVNASSLTNEATKYIEDGRITIPEYVGDIEVIGIADNAFSNYEITEITLLSSKVLTIGTNSLPSTLIKLRVNSCLVNNYNIDVEIEGFGTCEVSLYKDPVLNGADPELDEGMIPVIIASDGSLAKADTRLEWYNYSEKEWANVVLVDESVRSEYINADAGTTIKVKDIKAYYVWVPRYKYEIFTDVENLETVGSISSLSNYKNKAQIINVVFENKYTEKSTGTSKGQYITHPAFTFGSKELNGIWVGKFETTGTASEPTVLGYDSRYTETNNITSLRNQNVSTQFLTSQKINYGLTTFEASMLKNSEWGAVAYLTASNYGQGLNEVMINNSSNYNTGCAATVAPTTTYGGYKSQTNHSEGYYKGCENEWYTILGQKASTTGNITGIYDMSGGAWEYVMGVMEDSKDSGVPASGRNNLYNSGFTGSLTCPKFDTNLGNNSSITSITGIAYPMDSKYYDIYAYNTSSIVYAGRGHLGDATYELDGFSNWVDSNKIRRYHSGWNQDYAGFVGYEDPWFNRGGAWDDGTSAGVLAFYSHHGGIDTYRSFRSVLR